VPLRGAARAGARGGLATAALIVIGALGSLAASGGGAAATSISGSFGTAGQLLLEVHCTLAGPGAVRAAMDGNFTPLLASSAINASVRESTYARIGLLRSMPVVAGWFGDGDGRVSAPEVAGFAALMGRANSSLLPGLWEAPGTIDVRLDGAVPTFSQLQSLAFEGAEGPRATAANVSLDATTLYRFSFPAGTAALDLDAPARAAPLGCAGDFSIDLSLPAGDRYQGAAGFVRVSVQQDPWGLAPSRVVGDGSWASNGTVEVRFAPAFPLGVVPIVGGPALLLLAAYVVLRRRGRRDRILRAPAAPAGTVP
jgi:hypothetical protein